jgi:Cep192 domain 4
MGSASAPQTVTLTNSGNATLAISGIALSGANAGDFTQTNTCGASVVAGTNCAIKATFTPTATGTRNASLHITDNATGSPHTISLTGTGVPPATAAGNYTLTVAASSSNGVSHSIALTLTVM